MPTQLTNKDSVTAQFKVTLSTGDTRLDKTYVSNTFDVTNKTSDNIDLSTLANPNSLSDSLLKTDLSTYMKDEKIVRMELRLVFNGKKGSGTSMFSAGPFLADLKDISNKSVNLETFINTCEIIIKPMEDMPSVYETATQNCQLKPTNFE